MLWGKLAGIRPFGRPTDRPTRKRKWTGRGMREREREGEERELFKKPSQAGRYWLVDVADGR